MPEGGDSPGEVLIEERNSAPLAPVVGDVNATWLLSSSETAELFTGLRVSVAIAHDTVAVLSYRR